jgi:hypothetical protein
LTSYPLETRRKRDHSRSKPRRAQYRRPQQYPLEVDAGAAVPALGYQLASDEDRVTRNPTSEHAHHQQRVRGIDAARHLRGEPPSFPHYDRQDLGACVRHQHAQYRLLSILSAYAQITAATTRVAILAYTMPIWAVLLAWAVLRERPNASQMLAVVLCALGLAVLIYPLAKGGVPLGLLLALAAGAVWGAGTVYIKWAQLKLDPLGATFWQLLIASARLRPVLSLSMVA